jgi:lycopene cyclase CruP
VEFNPVRIGFHGGADVWTKDVLNIGVSPAKLIEKVI